MLLSSGSRLPLIGLSLFCSSGWSAVFGTDLLLLVKASSSSSMEMAHGNHRTPLLLSVEIVSQHYLIWAGFNPWPFMRLLQLIRQMACGLWLSSLDLSDFSIVSKVLSSLKCNLLTFPADSRQY